MLSHGDIHLLLWVLQKHITKRHSPYCGIQGGKGAEGTNLFLAQYFAQLAVFPLSFDYFLHLLSVCWVRGRTRRKGTGWYSDQTTALYCAVASHVGTEPGERGTHWDRSPSPSPHSAPLPSEEAHPAMNGLGMVREEGGVRSPPSLAVRLQRLM